MNLQQLEGISDELDLIYSLFAEEMLQSMHSSDYIAMTINPQYNDSTSNMRVTEGLSSFCENQSIISNAFFYATFSEMVYSSSRTVMELNAFPRRDVIHRYMEQEDLPGIYYQREKSWRLFSYTPTQVYLITEMTTPVLVSLMFCQLDLQGLQDLNFGAGESAGLRNIRLQRRGERNPCAGGNSGKCKSDVPAIRG